MMAKTPTTKERLERLEIAVAHLYELVKDKSAPAPPILMAEAGEGAIQLSWEPVKDADIYRVYRQGVSLTSVRSTYYTDSDLDVGMPVLYWVTAVDESGNESRPSNVSGGIPV